MKGNKDVMKVVPSFFSLNLKSSWGVPSQPEEEGILIMLETMAVTSVMMVTRLHKLCHPTIRDGSTWSKFGARGDIFLFSNLGAL